MLDTERGQRLADDLARLLAHVGADPRLAIGDDHARLARRAGERGAQLSRHFGRHLDAGQAAADDQRGPLPERNLALGQSRDMRVEPTSRVVGIDIEGVLGEARYRRAHQPAAEREDQPVVRQSFGAMR